MTHRRKIVTHLRIALLSLGRDAYENFKGISIEELRARLISLRAEQRKAGLLKPGY